MKTWIKKWLGIETMGERLKELEFKRDPVRLTDEQFKALADKQATPDPLYRQLQALEKRVSGLHDSSSVVWRELLSRMDKIETEHEVREPQEWDKRLNSLLALLSDWKTSHANLQIDVRRVEGDVVSVLRREIEGLQNRLQEMEFAFSELRREKTAPQYVAPQDEWVMVRRSTLERPDAR
jgi:predicted  nucleic acid-binding Zn-ribbon protein